MIKNGQCNILPDRPCNGPGIIVAIVRSRNTLPHDLHKNTPKFPSINGHVYWNQWNHDGDDDSGESIGDYDYDDVVMVEIMIPSLHGVIWMH